MDKFADAIRRAPLPSLLFQLLCTYKNRIDPEQRLTGQRLPSQSQSPEDDLPDDSLSQQTIDRRTCTVLSRSTCRSVHILILKRPPFYSYLIYPFYFWRMRRVSIACGGCLKLINNFPGGLRQLFSPFLEFLRRLSHPIGDFASDLQWCTASI